MFVPRIYAALAALVISATFMGHAQAYPVTARSGVTTVTGVYNPLGLDLTLVDGTNALSYNSSTGVFSFSATFGGTYSGSGDGYPAPVGGQAGNWQLLFGTAGFPNVSASNSEGIITLKSAASGVVGTLTFLGTGIYDYTGVPPQDKPATNDYFDIYAAVGDFLRVTCQDSITTCNQFDAQSLAPLKLFGPYVSGDGGSTIDGSRINNSVGCIADGGGNQPCGGLQFSASSAPEPASLALVGLGLAGLALARRRQRRT